jgi:hypothetical protein
MAQKVRVFKLAREFGMDNETMVHKIQEMGIEARNYMSGLDAEAAGKVRRNLERERAENTIEEQIRPTVVRRRTRDGAPAKPKRVRPPKPTEADRIEEVPAVPEVAATPDVAPTPEVGAIPHKRPIAVEVPEKPVVEAAPVHVPAPEAPLAQAQAQAQTQAPEPPPMPEEMQPAAPATPLDVSFGKSGEGAPIVEEKRRPKVEIATGPAVRRPSAEAPVIRRRISSPGRQPRAQGRASGQPPHQ